MNFTTNRFNLKSIPEAEYKIIGGYSPPAEQYRQDMRTKVYKYELQVFCGGYWQSRGHYESRKAAWMDVAEMSRDGDPYRHFKHRVIVSKIPYIEEI